MKLYSSSIPYTLQYIDLVLAGDLMNPIWSFEVGIEDACNDCSGDPGAPWPSHATTLRPNAFLSGVPRPQGADASLRFAEEDVNLGGPQSFGLRRIVANANANVSGLFGGGQASVFEKKVEISNVLGNAHIFDGSQNTTAGRTSSIEIEKTTAPQEVRDEVVARGLENEPLSWHMVEYGVNEEGEYTNPNFRGQARAYIVTYGGNIVAQRTEIMYPSGYMEVYGSNGWLVGQRDINKNGFDITYGEWDLVDMFDGSTEYRPLPQQYVEVLADDQTSRCLTFVLDTNIGNLITEIQSCNQVSLATYSYVNGVMTQADRQDGSVTYAWSQVGTTPLLTNAGGLSNLARKGDAVISYDPIETTRVNNISYGGTAVAVERDAAGIKYTSPTGYAETHLHSAQATPLLAGSEFAGGIVGSGVGDPLSNTITRDPITQQPTRIETDTQVVENTYDLQSRLPESTVISEGSKDTTIQRGYDGTKVNSLSVQSGGTGFTQNISYQPASAGNQAWGVFAGNPLNITMNKEGETFTVYQTFNPAGLPETIDYAGTTAGDTFVYNPSGCLTSVNGVSLVVDERCNPTTITDRNSNVSTAGYDLSGRLETSLDAAGGTVTLAYGDTIGSPDYGLLASVTDRGIATSYAYTNNRQIDTISVGGQQVVDYLYDSVGNIQKITDGDGVVREMIRGAEGHVDSSCIGASNAECYNYTYDPQGRLLTVEDPNNKTTTFTPGHMGRVASVLAADSGTIAYEYDELGNLTKLTDPNSKITTYRYGPVGELLEEVRPGGRSTTYAYDGKRRLTQQTSPNGSTMTYVYDAGNNTIDEVSDISYSDGRTVTYGRDANGNILNESDSAVLGAGNVYSATYDPLDRVDTLSVAYANLSFDYDYYANAYGGNLQQLALGGAVAATQSYSYDSQGRLSGINDSEAGNIAWTLSTAGRVSSLNLPGSGNYVYTYDTEDKGRLVDIAGTNLDLEYTYDAAGNVLSRTIDGTAESYTYDNVNRLLTSGSETFAYDHAGNRITSNGETWTYSDRNELTEQGTNLVHTYDNNGNLTQSDYTSGAYATYDWNAADQLTTFQYFASGSSVALTTATYVYDSSGRRVQKDIDGTVTKYVWEGPRMMAELDGTNTIQRRYVYRGFTPLAMVDYTTGSAVPYYYLTDAIGTPHKMVDAGGTVVWSAEYTVFGEATITTGTVNQNLRFPGQYYDSESGLHYNYKRYYDPGTGRYVSMDPARDAEDYAYAGNNPISASDPDGKRTRTLSAELTAIVGGGIEREFGVFSDHRGDWGFFSTKGYGAGFDISGAIQFGTYNVPTPFGEGGAFSDLQGKATSVNFGFLKGAGSYSVLDVEDGSYLRTKQFQEALMRCRSEANMKRPSSGCDRLQEMFENTCRNDVARWLGGGAVGLSIGSPVSLSVVRTETRVFSVPAIWDALMNSSEGIVRRLLGRGFQ